MPKNILRSEEIAAFLREDSGAGDVTSAAIFDPAQEAGACFIAKEDFLCAGLMALAAPVFAAVNPAIVCKGRQDGHRITAGDKILTVQGPVLDLLRAERVALNLVQRACGIATLTARFVDAVRGTGAKIVDTRKTTPGLRALEKYAVRVGGGHNHRFDLGCGILIKDNHIAACGSIAAAVAKVREQAPHGLRIEVEAETLDQVEECLACGAEIILLDNMETAAIEEAVALINGRALVEASGGVTLANVGEIARTGVDFISIGALTHSAPAVDISMRLT